MTNIKLAPAAQKSLALQKDGVFRLLVVMTALLGWIIAMGFGGLVLMQNVYGQWQLQRSTEVSIYLMADSPSKKIKELQDVLLNKADIKSVTRLKEEEVTALIAPYINISEEAQSFPLPVILNMQVNQNLNHDSLTQSVQNIFPEAEVDDARALLATAASAVRLAQLGALGLSLCLFVIMAFLVTLTVRTGLRAQKETLAILRYIGSTDAFLAKLVVQQVTRRALVGWLIAITAAIITFGALITFWPLLQGYALTPILPLTVILVPLILPLLAYLASKSATKKMLH